MASKDKTRDPQWAPPNGTGTEDPTETMNAVPNGDHADRANDAARRAEEAARRAEQAAGASSGPAAAPPGAIFVTPSGVGGATGEGPALFAVQGLPQLPPPPGAKRRKDWTFWVPVTALAFLASAGLLVGLFFIGRGSRPSDEDIAGRIHRSVAHQQGVDAAVQTKALSAQRHGMNVRFNKRLKAARKSSFDKGQSQGYSSGQSVGYSAGQTAGHSAGVTEGQQQGYSQGQTDGFFQGLFAGG